MRKMPNKAPGLIVQEIGTETLVYDSNAGKVHNLGSLAAEVFALCDGQTRFKDAAKQICTSAREFRSESLALVLSELETSGLVSEFFGPQSRREFIKAAGRAGAALPFLTSVLLATPVAASSGTCVDCPGGFANCGPSGCPGASANACCECGISGAGSPCPQPTCTCLQAFRRNGTSCLTDAALGIDCLSITATSNLRVQMDCCSARSAATGGGTYTIVQCDSAAINVGEDLYFCCNNCTNDMAGCN